VEVQLHAHLTSALDGRERSVSRFGRFITGGRAPFITRTQDKIVIYRELINTSKIWRSSHISERK